MMEIKKKLNVHTWEVTGMSLGYHALYISLPLSSALWAWSKLVHYIGIGSHLGCRPCFLAVGRTREGDALVVIEPSHPGQSHTETYRGTLGRTSCHSEQVSQLGTHYSCKQLPVLRGHL